MRRSDSTIRAWKRRRRSFTAIAITSSGLVVPAAVAAATNAWAAMTRVAQRCQARQRPGWRHSGRGPANHPVSMRTSHGPEREPESVPNHAVKEGDVTLDNDRIVRQAYKSPRTETYP